MKTRSRAVLSENDQRSAIPIRANALVVVVGGNIDEDAFVKIRYEGKLLLMLAEAFVAMENRGDNQRRSLENVERPNSASPGADPARARTTH